MSHLISVEARLKLIAASAGLSWSQASKLTFADFAKKCAARRKRPQIRLVPPIALTRRGS